jgi:hypothetical protein
MNTQTTSTKRNTPATLDDVADELQLVGFDAGVWHSGGGIELVRVEDGSRYWQFGPNGGTNGDVWGWDIVETESGAWILSGELPLKNTAPAWFVAEFIALRIQQAR